MATYKETLERLINREEVVYWGAKNGVVVEDTTGGLSVGEYIINLDDNDQIISVERRLDVPQKL